MATLGLLDRFMGGKLNPRFKSIDDVLPSNLEGKNVIITGGTSGLGRVCAIEIAKRNAQVSQTKAKEVIELVKKDNPNAKIEAFPCDLADWASVEKFSQEILKRDIPIHALINNAGIIAVRNYEQGPFEMELQMSTNHFGHFLLTRQVWPLIRKAAKESGDARVVNVSASSYVKARKRGTFFPGGLGFDCENANNPKPYGFFWSYKQTKLANVLFTRELAKLINEHGCENIYVNSLHPGAVDTGMVNSMPLQFLSQRLRSLVTKPEISAMTQLYAAFHPDVKEKKIQGQFMMPICHLNGPHYSPETVQSADKFWSWTEEYLAKKGLKTPWKWD